MTSRTGSAPRYSDDGTRPEDVLSEGSTEMATDSAAEQGRRLLGDDEAGCARTTCQKQKRRAWWRPLLFFGTVLASFLTLLILVKIALFDGSMSTAAAGAEAEAGAGAEAPPLPPPETLDKTVSFRRPDSDYVLDPGWDFDAPPTVREYNWAVQNIEANPDGVFRMMTTINGKFPGELIRCNEGDTIVVNVENQAINATSIHWHGLFQNGTNHMDGTPGATQCPIAPGRSFRYEFVVSGQSGTYFYHGHQGAEALDGLVGPIVVHSRDEPRNQLLPYDTDRIVMVQDWYYDMSGELLIRALEPGSESAPLPNGALVNGANVANCSAHPDRTCDASTARLPALDLARGANHRLRFINVGALAWFEVSLDRHHNLPVTEVDGVAIVPSSEKSILIAPGQRYSVVLTANETGTADQAYWLRARITTHCFAEYTLAGQDNPTALAMVRYTDGKPGEREETLDLDPARIPKTDGDSGAYIVLCQDMNTRQGIDYQPVPVQPAPESADHSYYFRLNLEIHDFRLQRGYLNESSYRPNIASPALHRAIDGLREGNAAYSVAGGAGINAVAFDRQSELVLAHDDTSVIDLIFQNFDEGSHPLHLHGHQMYVLGAGHGYFPGYASLGLQPGGRGLLDAANRSVIANPVRRDVAAVEGFGWTMVRVVADNPGVWKFHCHMVWHGDGGMGMLLLSRTAQLRSWEVPAANRALCEASVEELKKGAVPDDSIWHHI